MRALLFELCVDQRHAAPAFLRFAAGAFAADWIAADAPDSEVLVLARSLDRTLVTGNADFGDLIYRDRLAPPPGVVLVMTQLIPAAERQSRLADLTGAALEVAEGNFVVVGPQRIRFRPLPGTQGEAP